MSFKSKIYDREGVQDDIDHWPLDLLAGLLIPLGYLLTDVNGVLGAVVMLSSIVILYYSLYKDNGNLEEEGEYVGEICLTSELFMINNESFTTTDISNVRIVIGNKKGHINRYGRKYRLDSGTTSSLKFTIHGADRYFNFKLISDQQIEDLKTVIEGLYQKGIFVLEFYRGKRTYLLKELTYKEIQEFKKKYSLVGSI